MSETTAATLRRAAAKMRALGEAVDERDYERVTRKVGRLTSNGQHIASWHPDVALAVADWLDTAGADLWAHGPLHCDDGCMECDDDLWAPHVRRALHLARTYLGEAS